MRKLFFDKALLPDGWAAQVAVSVDGRGTIMRVERGAQAEGAERFAGTALAGMPNLHSHAHQRAIAGLGERSGAGADDGFWSWRDAMYRAVARITPEDFAAVAAQLYVEMLKSGYTAVGEFHYLHNDRDGADYADPAEMASRAIAAAREAGIAMTMLPVLYAASGFGGRPPVEGQRRFVRDGAGFARLVEALRARHAEAPDVVIGIAPHSLRAVPAELLAETVAAAPQGPIHIHVAEQPREVADCLAHTGRRPVEWLLDEMPVDGRWCLVHATHMTAAETAQLAASGAVAGLCPTTEANLGDGIFPAEQYFGAGGGFGIGSDSHVSVSPVEELRWLEYGQRLICGRRAVLAGGPGRSTGRRLVEAAQAGGARALGLAAGAIAPGMRADLVVLDDAHPLLAGRQGDRLLDAWVFAGNVPLVKDVVVGGRAVIRGGRHPEEEAIAERFRDAVRRLTA